VTPHKRPEPDRFFGGNIANRWGKQIGATPLIRCVVRASSAADAIRVLEAAGLGVPPGHFREYFAETGNTLDMALCWRRTRHIWVYHDQGALCVYDEAWRKDDE